MIFTVLAMMGIVSAVDMKHVEFIPDLVACNKLLVTVRAACDTADQSLVSVASYLRNQGKEVECNVRYVVVRHFDIFIGAHFCFYIRQSLQF